MTTSQIEAENTQMTNDLYRLLKKYTGLRNLIRELKVNKTFIIIYITLINLIKILRLFLLNCLYFKWISSICLYIVVVVVFFLLLLTIPIDVKESFCYLIP